MSERNETWADIAAELREEAACEAKDPGGWYEQPTEVVVNRLNGLADRIEAAGKRETVAGNAAKLREVLENVRDWLVRANNGPLDALATSQFILTARSVNDPAKGVIRDNEYHIGQIDAVLSAPPRNCDVGTAEEQEERYLKLKREHVDRMARCPAVGQSFFFPDSLYWAQLPYDAAQEGGEA